MNENEILGFNPQDLTVFNQEESSSRNFNSNIYHTRPIDAKSDDGIYRATIKIIYNPFDLRQSILEQQSYGLQDSVGWFSVISSLTINDTSCPIFKAWKKCHYAEKGSSLWRQAASVDEGGKALFDKRFARYVTIQVIEDKNQPELNGKYMLWKLPKSIWDTINAKMKPSPESKKASIPVMDFLFGRSFDLEVTPGPGNPNDPRYKRETKYLGELSEDVVSCTYPDGSPLLNDDEQDVLDTYVSAVQKIWKNKDPEERARMTSELNEDPNTIKLREIYSKVIEIIKGFCPNLIDELSYKPWSDEIKTRVQNWIDVVLNGGDPAASENVPDQILNANVANNVGNETPKKVESPVAKETDDNDDLPF